MHKHLVTPSHKMSQDTYPPSLHTRFTLILVFTENMHVYHINKQIQSHSYICSDRASNKMCFLESVILEIWLSLLAH